MNEALVGIGTQGIWLIGLMAFGSLIMRVVLRRVTVQGG